MVKAKPADPTATFHVSARFRQKNQKRARQDREGEGKTFRAWPSPANGAGRPAVAGATERRCGGVMCRRGGATGFSQFRRSGKRSAAGATERAGRRRGFSCRRAASAAGWSDQPKQPARGFFRKDEPTGAETSFFSSPGLSGFRCRVLMDPARP